MVDASVAEHLEVLGLAPVRFGRAVERVAHAHAFDRVLLDAVDDGRVGQTGSLENRRGNVDHVVELRTHLAPRREPVRPVHDRAVARPAPVRRDLLRPLIRGVHRVCPADRVVVVRGRRPEIVDVRRHELGGLECSCAIEHHQLVERPLHRSFRARAVVADDVVDERVIEDAEVLERIDQPPEVVVGVLEKACVDLHLASKDRLEVVGNLVPGGNLLVPRRQLCLGRHDAELLLAGEDLLAQLVPALIEPALVLVGPLLRNVVWRVGSPRREVDEERLVGHERLLRADPRDRLVGHVLGEVVALLGRLVGLDRSGSFVDRGVVLVRLAADEAVEVLEASAAGRPRVERTERARLPDRNLVALAELRCRIAVHDQRLRERSAGVRPQRVVAGRRRRELGDDAHSDRVMVATGEERGSGRRAERRRVEAVVLETLSGETLGRRCAARTTECARSCEADVVQQDDKNVRCPVGRPQWLDRRKLRLRVLRVEGRRPAVRLVGDRKHISLDLGGTQLVPPFRSTTYEDAGRLVESTGVERLVATVRAVSAVTAWLTSHHPCVQRFAVVPPGYDGRRHYKQVDLVDRFGPLRRRCEVHERLEPQPIRSHGSIPWCLRTCTPGSAVMDPASVQVRRRW